MRERAHTLALCALIASAACHAPRRESQSPTYPPIESGVFGSMRNVSVSGRIWFGGAPDEGDLDLARRRGIETVIDLTTPDETNGVNAAQVCARLGLEYRHLGLPSPERLTDEAVDLVLAWLGPEERGRTLMFCGNGGRCATFLAIYRALAVGVPVEEALVEARRAGMRPGEPEEFVRRQVERLRPRQAAEAPADAPAARAPADGSAG